MACVVILVSLDFFDLKVDETQGWINYHLKTIERDWMQLLNNAGFMSISLITSTQPAHCEQSYIVLCFVPASKHSHRTNLVSHIYLIADIKSQSFNKETIALILKAICRLKAKSWKFEFDDKENVVLRHTELRFYEKSFLWRATGGESESDHHKGRIYESLLVSRSFTRLYLRLWPVSTGWKMMCFRYMIITIIYCVHQHSFELACLLDDNRGRSYISLAVFWLHLLITSNVATNNSVCIPGNIARNRWKKTLKPRFIRVSLKQRAAMYAVYFFISGIFESVARSLFATYKYVIANVGWYSCFQLRIM